MTMKNQQHQQQQQQQQQQQTKNMSCSEMMILVVLLFGFPIPFVLLVSQMQQLKLPYFVDALSVGYSLLLIAFVQMGAAILRWTARLIVTRKRDEKEEVDTMTPLLLVAFPQWMLCLATIWTAVLNSHARDAPTGTYVALAKSLVTICIPLLAILRAFHQATHMIDNVQEQKEDLLQKKEEHAQKILALTRNVHHRRFNGVTSCLKLL